MIELFPERAIALQVFGLAIHWYGLLYLLSFAVVYFAAPRLQGYRTLSLSKEEWAELLSFSVLGVIVGGRLGYVILYEPAQYFAQPWQIFAVWNGGMSSHGGFIGVSVALLYYCRKHKISPLRLSDTVMVPVAIGLAFGRIGNFINLELYGRVTDLPWGISIPGVEGLRHPTQIYAVIKDLFIASVCFMHLRTPRSLSGRTTAIFLMVYAVLRFMNEFLRVPSHSVFHFGDLSITRGQAYTIPLFIAGVIIWVLAGRMAKNSDRLS